MSALNLTPFLSTIGAAVGALATIGGVAITSRSSRKAEDKRLALEIQREETRIRREDESQTKTAEEERNRKQTQVYEGLAQQFVNELSNLRAIDQPKKSDKDLAEWFAREWPPLADMRLRRAIAALTNDDHRLRLTQLCDAILDYAEMADLHWRGHHHQLELLITLGFDLTSTYARGQDVDSELSKRWNTFKKERQYTEDQEAEALKARVQALMERVGKTRLPKSGTASTEGPQVAE